MAAMPGLHELRDLVEHHLDQHVRPFLTSHAGGIRVERVDAAGTVDLAFEGACASCPISGTTFYGAVEPAVASIGGVTLVNAPSNVNISRAAARRIVALSRPTPTTDGGPS